MIYVVFDKGMSLYECQNAYRSLISSMKESELQALLDTNHRIRKKGYHYHCYKVGGIKQYEVLQRIEVVEERQLDIFPLFLCPSSSYILTDVLVEGKEGLEIPHMNRMNFFFQWLLENKIDIFNLKKGFKKGNVVYYETM